MIFSTKYSFLILRLSLALVFFWFGIDKFFHPNYWLTVWVPDWTQALVVKFGITTTQFIYINGIFEVLIGLSLTTGIFMKFFSVVGMVFLSSVALAHGFSFIAVRDIGLMGALLAIFFWPERSP